MLGFIWQIVLFFLPYVATLFLLRIGWKMWIHYIQQDFISGIEWTLLEIVPPRDVLRSPRGMELFFTNALYHWSMKGGREEYWQGAVWFWFSLEIASIEGQVHFYIRTPSRVAGLIETQIYAQYPQAQVKVVEDYTLAVDEISPKSAWNGWGCEFTLEHPDAIPIKTYIDYGLDKESKEELKVDPVSPIIELFGSMQKGEQMWMQIIITPSKQKYPKHRKMFEKTHDWVKESEMYLLKKLEPFTRQHARADGTFAQEIRPPKHLEVLVESITKKIQKLGFDTGIRVFYAAKKEAFQMNSRRNLRLVFRQFSSPYLNSLVRINSTQADAYNGYFPASTTTVMMLANRMLREFQERSFFHLPMRHHLFNKHVLSWPFSAFFKAYFHPETFVMNVEELATLWHFPGQILKVPTLERIESKEASPPTNLPT